MEAVSILQHLWCLHSLRAIGGVTHHADAIRDDNGDGLLFFWHTDLSLITLHSSVGAVNGFLDVLSGRLLQVF